MNVSQVIVTVTIVTDENPARAMDRSSECPVAPGADAIEIAGLCGREAAGRVIERLAGGDNRRGGGA